MTRRLPFSILVPTLSGNSCGIMPGTQPMSRLVLEMPTPPKQSYPPSGPSCFFALSPAGSVKSSTWCTTCGLPGTMFVPLM